MEHYERLEADIRVNLSRDFVGALESALQWEYSASYDSADRRGEGPPFHSDHSHGRMLLDRHLRNRHSYGSVALANATTACGGSVEHRLVPTNGQRKVVASIGPFCFITETVTEFPHRPEFALYKSDLSRAYAAIRQLEFDFVDGGFAQSDWTGRHLGVVLHGCRGETFTRTGTSLGMMRIAFPNSAYDSWVWAADVLNGQLAERLGWNVGSKKRPQRDLVAVRLRSISDIKDKK